MKLIPACFIGLNLFSSYLFADDRPNILFCFSDDWGRYASIYRDPTRPGLNDVIQTPALDAIGRSGVVFNNAFVPAPTCKPCRRRYRLGCRSIAVAAMPSFTARNSAKRWTILTNHSPGFPEILVRNGYHVMHWGKTTTKSAKRVDHTNVLPICHFSQAVSAATDKEAKKQEIFSFVRIQLSRVPRQATRR